MATGRLLYAASLFGLALPATLAAQPVTTAEDPIVVEARRVKSAGSDIRAVAAPFEDQLPRFESPICPHATGFPPEAAAAIVARIREIAIRVGARADAAGCVPNLLVVAPPDGAKFIKRLYYHRPRWFGKLTANQSQTLHATPGPAWTWQSVQTRQADGMPLMAGDYGVQQVARFGDASRITVPVRQDTQAAFVVLDGPKIEGLTLLQIADFAAMTGLASIRSVGIGYVTRRSILTLLDDHAAGRAAAREATPFDIAYLTGLYAGSGARTASQKSLEIATRVAHAEGN